MFYNRRNARKVRECADKREKKAHYGVGNSSRLEYPKRSGRQEVYSYFRIKIGEKKQKYKLKQCEKLLQLSDKFIHCLSEVLSPRKDLFL